MSVWFTFSMSRLHHDYISSSSEYSICEIIKLFNFAKPLHTVSSELMFTSLDLCWYSQIMFLVHQVCYYYFPNILIRYLSDHNKIGRPYKKRKKKQQINSLFLLIIDSREFNQTPVTFSVTDVYLVAETKVFFFLLMTHATKSSKQNVRVPKTKAISPVISYKNAGVVVEEIN